MTAGLTERLRFAIHSLLTTRRTYALMLIVPEEPDGETLAVSVVKVFDGDGFLAKATLPNHTLDIELSVRMGFIDAPEIGQHGGDEARDFLCSIIERRTLI